MRYLISDIHGCYDQYRQLLQKINFSSQDELYVLGDAVDRGSDPIKVLQDLMRRPNIIYILGNHDLEMYVSPTQVEYAALNDYDERKAGLLRIVRQLYSD